MKKKIGVFANGWNNLSIVQALKGIRSVTDELNIDIFLFLSFAVYGRSKMRNQGDDSIFDLPDYSDLDGAIVFSNMLNSEHAPIHIAQKIVENNIPGVSVGIPLEGLSVVGIDNFKGMYEMVDHLVKEHHIKNPAFFAGAKTHPDSNERLDATRQALESNGIELKPENICYTNWEYLTSMEYAMEFCKRPNPPDSFICANDYNAIAACIGLSKMGYSVPKDFIVTGFDKIPFAETFYPSITTVYQDYEKIGYIAAWQLMEKINESSSSDKVIVSSKFVRNESCGCKKEEDAEFIRHDFCISAYKREMESLISQGNDTKMTTAIFSNSSYDKLEENFLTFYKENKTFPGNEFYICLDSTAKKSLISSSSPMQSFYSDDMYCLVAKKDTKTWCPGKFNRKDLIPGYKKSDKPVVYTLCSIHYDDSLFGYFVISDAIEQIKDTTLNHYSGMMNYNFEQYRKNCKLEEMNRTLLNISNTDQLTGLNNRFGMEQNGVTLLTDAHKQNKPCAVVFIDINRMKHINDNFGHLQGDLAIRTVSSAMLSTMPENWLGIRYGGDEFIALGICDDSKFVEEYIAKIKDNLEKQVSSMHLAYPLTASCGYIMTDPTSSATLEDYISKADSIMYEIKQEMHRQEAAR